MCVTYDKWANDRVFIFFLAMTSFKVDAATWPLPFFTFLFFFLFFGLWNVVWQQSRRIIIHPSMRCHWAELCGRKQRKGRDSRLMATFYFFKYKKKKTKTGGAFITAIFCFCFVFSTAT